MLAISAGGCGEGSAPAPAATDSPVATESPPPAAGASIAAPTIPTEAAAPAPSAIPSPALAIPAKLNALGTEPFWNARIDGTRLTYTTPEDQEGQSTAVTRHDLATGTQFAGKLGGAALLVEVSRKACSDGMSDRTFPFEVVLTLGADRREGCAS
jgi:uncharacterized membrane protein